MYFNQAYRVTLIPPIANDFSRRVKRFELYINFAMTLESGFKFTIANVSEFVKQYGVSDMFALVMVDNMVDCCINLALRRSRSYTFAP